MLLNKNIILKYAKFLGKTNTLSFYVNSKEDLFTNNVNEFLVELEKQKDQFNCKSKKINKCNYPCTKINDKCVPIPKRSWLVFPTDNYSEGKWMGTKNKKVFDETSD